MDIAELIAGLSDPSAYPQSVESVEVRQTHLSAVFLAGPFVYKVKKPVDLGFVDFREAARRLENCEREVRLNRRLAPEVYLGVVPIVARGDRPIAEGEGPVIDWAVKMRRLPDEATLRSRLDRGEVGPEELRGLARRLAEFHRTAESGPSISAFGRFEVVARNARENLEQSRDQVGRTISERVVGRLSALIERSLTDLQTLIDDRARRQVPRDTHGDLRLEHVYHFPDREAPADWLVIDCIEFGDRYRHADPVADAAFLAMDLIFQGHRDLASTFTDAYIEHSGDTEGRPLWPFYISYRAAVRGKVEGMALAEREVPEAGRSILLETARSHWLLALATLEEPAGRPGLVLVGGLPGTGKTTLARALAEDAGLEVIRSDVVRKELAGLEAEASARAAFGSGIYGPDWDERTASECLRRAEAILFEGGRVLVDATFRSESWRRRFVEAAGRWRVPCRLLICQAPAEVVRGRLERRKGDASDADWAVYLRARAAWEGPGPGSESIISTINTGESLGLARREALDHLHAAGLWS